MLQDTLVTKICRKLREQLVIHAEWVLRCGHCATGQEFRDVQDVIPGGALQGDSVLALHAALPPLARARTRAACAGLIPHLP